MYINLSKKLSLIFFGIIISLIILEVILQITSFGYQYYTKSGYFTEFNSHNNLTIVTLGESTTANNGGTSWPEQLSNKLSDDNVSHNIINLAVPGIQVNLLMKNFEEYLINNKPNVVIAMIGINDQWNNFDQFHSNKFYSNFKKAFIINFKVTKLFPLIAESLIDKSRNFVLADLGYFTKHSLIHNLEKYYNKYDSLDNKSKLLIYDFLSQKDFEFNYDRFIKLTRENEDSIFMKKIAYLILNNSLNDSRFSLRSIWTSLHYPFYEFFKNNDSMKLLLKDRVYSNIDKNTYYYLADLAWFYYLIEDYNESINLFNLYILSAESLNPESYKGLGLIYAKLNLTEKSDYYFNLYDKNKGLSNYNSIIINNYYSLYDLSKKHNFNLVLMQYPTRSIDSLKDLFIFEKDIIYISNEDNFKQELLLYPYDFIFTDNFASDFGHCTEYGNQLIANNVYSSLDKYGLI